MRKERGRSKEEAGKKLKGRRRKEEAEGKNVTIEKIAKNLKSRFDSSYLSNESYLF